ncbi:MAG: hypothetical protein ACI4PU_09585, partial [Intestinibacter sp.]
MKLKKALFLLVMILSIVTFNQNIIFADSIDESVSVDISGYTFTYENAPLEIKEQYEESCQEMGVTPLPDDEIFISENNINNYNIGRSSGTYATYTIRAYDDYFRVTGSKDYIVYTYTRVGYNYVTNGNPVHLVQLLLSRAGYNLIVDSS